MNGFKDKATALILKRFANANQFVAEFGQIENLKINSSNKTILVVAKFKGERESVTISIDGYEIIKKDNKHFVKLNNVSTTKEWLNVVLSKQNFDSCLEIPARLAYVAKAFL